MPAPELHASAKSPTLSDQRQPCSRTELERWFGQPFTLRNAATGEVVLPHLDVPLGDEGFMVAVTPAIVRTGQATIVAEEAGCCFLAIPLEEDQGVAISPFRISEKSLTDDAARFMGVAPSDLPRWLHGKSVWSCAVLERMAALFIEKMASDRRNAQLSAELEKTSKRLSATYQEVSLLYGLTQNLRISGGVHQLGQQALDWLSEVIACEGLAIQYLLPEYMETTRTKRDSVRLLRSGEVPLDAAAIDGILRYFRKTERQSICIANARTTSLPDWPCPEIRHLAAVPLLEGENLFGWLFALNHELPEGFGTLETSLLSSVAAILGIHSANTEHDRHQSDFLTGVVRAFTSAIDAKDPYTCGHSDRVARLSVCLARQLGLETADLNLLYMSGLLHDVGKIGIDDAVLRKTDRLTDEEYEQIKLHPELGCDILKDLKPLVSVLPVVRHHHEQWDGKGYPYGLKEREIPVLARITAVADAYDAMSSDRPYRCGMPDEKVDAIFRAGAGTQWDPEVVEAFFACRDQLRELIREERSSLPFDVQVWIE